MNSSEAPGPSQPQIRACNECQKRKSKCTGESPCAFCTKTNRNCVYTPRPIRTPLTRKNLDATEQKCEKLVALLKSLNPDIDIDEALGNGIPSSSSSSLPPINHIRRSSDELNEASPGSSHEYEWHEDPLSNDEEQDHSLRDGMALLSTNPSGSGYIGSSAGSSLLQTILSLVSLKEPLDDPSRKELSKFISTKERSEPGALLLEADLASSLVTEGLIDAYFLFYNSSYPILHSQLFRESYSNRSQISSSSTWQLIFYTVLAIGHWVLSSGENHADSPYYSAARSRISAGILESGTLAGVQAFLLMGNYLQKRDRPNTGYNMIGIAFRMALGLGLHREVSGNEGAENTLSKEIRRRVWWILYMVDSGFSITMGRPTMASDAFIDVRLPQNVDDSAYTSENLAVALPEPVDYPTTYSAMVAQARLSIIANKIYNQFLSAHISNAAISEQLAGNLEEELLVWPPRAVILWKEQNLRMMLWRGGQRSHKSHPRSEAAIQNCLSVAIETVQAICSFCAQNQTLHQGVSWYATYFLFQAVLVIDVGLLQAPEDSQAVLWRSIIEQARQCLSQLSSTNPAAGRCISVLNRIHHLSVASSHQRQTAHETCGGSLQHSTDTTLENTADYAFDAADAAHQFFLDDPPTTNLFDGLSGFPSNMQEHENFDYIGGDFYNMEDFDMFMSWPENQL